MERHGDASVIASATERTTACAVGAHRLEDASERIEGRTTRAVLVEHDQQDIRRILLDERAVGFHRARRRGATQYREESHAHREIAARPCLHGHSRGALVTAHRCHAAGPFDDEERGHGGGREHQDGAGQCGQSPPSGICGRDNGDEDRKRRDERRASNGHAHECIARRDGGLQHQRCRTVPRHEEIAGRDGGQHDVVHQNGGRDDRRDQPHTHRVEHLQHEGEADGGQQPRDPRHGAGARFRTRGNGDDDCRRDQESAEAGQLREDTRCLSLGRHPAGEQDVPRQHRDRHHQGQRGQLGDGQRIERQIHRGLTRGSRCGSR